MTPFGSLGRRLALAGVIVALLAVVVTAYSVQRVTQSTIRGSIERDLSEEVFIRDELAFLGAYYGDWDEVADLVIELSTETGQRIAVATLDDEILADSELLRFDQSAPLPAQATIVDPA
ncbi:MAG: hypothetical protein GY773_19070, partial [Actinomycetia bacterium]|nr:hypothetical protein [Actinomycetes bacterium]